MGFRPAPARPDGFARIASSILRDRRFRIHAAMADARPFKIFIHLVLRMPLLAPVVVSVVCHNSVTTTERHEFRPPYTRPNSMTSILNSYDGPENL